MPTEKIQINRAPVMTLWATVVAERLGFDGDEALTLGKAVTGLNAQAKGRRLGIYEPSKDRGQKARQHPEGEEYAVGFFGREVPATNADGGVRATTKGKPIDPDSVRRYLHGKFGDHLDDVRQAMEELAQSYSPEELATRAYGLYEKFRPSIPSGKRGWGAKGNLDLDCIRSLAEE